MKYLLPVVGAGVAGLAGLAWHRRRKSSPGQMTPEREKVFQTALNETRDPSKLRQLATVFDNLKLKPAADALRKRANLRELPDEVKAARREVMEKALASDDKNKVQKVAVAFEGEGATATAQRLYQHAESLDAQPDIGE